MAKLIIIPEEDYNVVKKYLLRFVIRYLRFH